MAHPASPHAFLPGDRPSALMREAVRPTTIEPARAEFRQMPGEVERPGLTRAPNGSRRIADSRQEAPMPAPEGVPRSGPNLYDAEPIPEAALSEIHALLANGDLFRYTAALDSPVAKLESEFAAHMDVPFALAVNSCSSAIFLALKALAIEVGDKVLVPAFTFSAVPSAIVHAGAEPILVDGGSNYRIDMDDFAAKLERDVKAVVISHMRGHTSDMDAIMRLCDARHVPVVEDAAHSLGTLWSGRKIGTIGRIGCFSFQSFKLLNAGEGGMLITSDPDLIARAVIMSGAYEHNWKKHPIAHDRFAYWQNRLPLYNTRLNNLSAAVLRPQIAQISTRAIRGAANHDHVARILDASPWFDVPAPLDQEVRAPDSIQFNLVGFDRDREAEAFQRIATERGVPVQIFGLSPDNARAFWNWEFLGPQSNLEKTRAMLMRACDVRLPARLGKDDLDFVATALLGAADEVKKLDRPSKEG
jgi:dTDP-4-amino-4,6-dideoxygalactose transaminase